MLLLLTCIFPPDALSKRALPWLKPTGYIKLAIFKKGEEIEKLSQTNAK